MSDPAPGDHISIGDIKNAQGVAVGRGAQAHVTGNLTVAEHAATDQVDPAELRAVLDRLYDLLDEAGLPKDSMRKARRAAEDAIEGVTEGRVEATTVTHNIEKLGEAFKEANVTVQQGTSLGQSLIKLATLAGPLVAGGAHAIGALFGLPL